MDKVRIGVIGCGGMNGNHASRLVRMEDVEVVAVADPVAERREAMAKTLSAKRAYADHRALYDGEQELDAVLIAVPPAEHKGIEEEAIARKWNFKVEKPMTLDPVQAKAIAEATAKAGVVSAVGFQDRYLDTTDRIREALNGLDVGIAHATWAGGIPGVQWWRTYPTCGGQLTEQNIHLVDLMRYFFGEVKEVYAKELRGIVVPERDCPGYDNQDASVATYTMESGVIVTMHSACYLIGGAVPPDNGMTIYGRQMSIVYSLRQHVRFLTREKETLYPVRNDQIFDANRAFFDAVKKHDPAAVRSPYGDSLKTLNACFAANESMRTGKPVQL
jgi:predicted dehydrogenase